MGYTEKLIDMLMPLGVYRLDSGAGAAELYALGRAADKAAENLGEIERECVVHTAVDWGLSLYEELFPCVPGYADIESRRAAIMALLQVNDMTFTPKGINITLDGCGINADAAEGPEAQTVTVTFPGTKGTPTNFKSVLKGIIESIIPCHLNIIYVFDYLSWYELEATHITWGVISEMTWLDVERI